MKKYLLFIVFLLAFFLRIYKLGEFPYGFHVDEARVAWNAVSVYKAGLSDQLKNLGFYYNSFGDFRPTGIFYSVIPFMVIFGKSIFAIRLSSSLFGALTVIPIYFLTKKLFKNENMSILSASILSISPWHIEVSRATSEVAISAFFTIFAIYYLLLLIEKNSREYLFLNITFVSIAYLFYHAIRLLAPPFYLAILLTKKNFKSGALISLTWVILLSVLFTFSKQGLQRFSQVSFTKDSDISYEIQRISTDTPHSKWLKVFDSKYLIYTKHFFFQYFDYFSSNFLIGSSARPYRYTTPGYGLMGIVDLFLLVMGLFAITKNKASTLPIILLLIAPIPAALTIEDSPNLHRAFLMIPFISIIEAYGIIYLHKYKNLIFGLITISSIYFTHMYFYHSISHKPYLKEFFIDSPSFRNIGAVQLAKKLPDLQKSYDKIIITNFPDNPYPWFAFFNDIEPKMFNKNYSPSTNQRIWRNIVFSELKCPADDGLVTYNNQNVLFIENWECPYEAQMNGGYPLKVVDKILRPDGSLVYVFLTRDINKPLISNGKEIK